MEEFSTIKGLKEKYKTVRDLSNLLKEKGFNAGQFTIKKWEKSGLIPKARRVQLKLTQWRVYTQEEMEAILQILESKSRKVVSI